MVELHLILLLCSAAGAAAFSSSSVRCITRRSSFHFHRTTSTSTSSSSSLHDSLFNELFENGNDDNRGGGGNETLQDGIPPKNYNDDAPPFSEFESPRDRARRMEMARELQNVFYKDPVASSDSASSSSSQPSDATAGKSINIPYGSTVLRNLPTITTSDGIKNADESSLLPGYQFVWNIHNPQHCHMFHSILSEPAPWYFSHVHIPSSSASNFNSKSSADDDEDGNEKPIPIIDHIQSYSDIQRELKSGSPLYGTLLRITDSTFQDEDGSIVLAVQAIDRIRVHNVASSAVPGMYLSTDVQLSPEEEMMRMYFDKALMSRFSYISSHTDVGVADNIEEKNEALSSCPSAVSGAARAAASADTSRVRRFEYLPIFLGGKPKRPSRASSLGVQDEAKEQSGPEYSSVVQLVNYDAFAYSSLGKSDSVTSQALKSYWEHLAKGTSVGNNSSEEEDLFGSSSAEASDFFLPEPSASLSGPHGSVEAVEDMEYHLWRTLDEMIRLLTMATTATIPLPSQLLGLLPKRNDWPHGFALEDYAESLASSRSSIGTAFKSPFVRVDYIASSDPSAYSALRRAQRLSYAIWMLLDGLAMLNAQSQPPSRSEILSMGSIEQRLSAARQTLEGINAVLKKMIP